MRTVLLITCFFMAFHSNIMSQDTTKYEIGLRNIGFNLSAYTISTPNFFLKYKIDENKYRRYSVATGYLSFSKTDSTNQQANNGFTFVFGTEKRQPVKGKVTFLRGLQYILGANFFSNKNNNIATQQSDKMATFSPKLGLGYVLGLMYTASPQFNFGIETMPNVQISADFKSFKNQKTLTYNVNGGFDLASVSIFGAYRF